MILEMSMDLYLKKTQFSQKNTIDLDCLWLFNRDVSSIGKPKSVVLQVQEMEKFHAKVAMLDATIRAVMSHGEHVFLDTRQYRMRHPDFRAQTLKRMQTAEFENMPWNKEKNIGKNMRENVMKTMTCIGFV